MSKPNDKHSLQDMKEAGERIAQYVDGMTYEVFLYQLSNQRPYKRDISLRYSGHKRDASTTLSMTIVS